MTDAGQLALEDALVRVEEHANNNWKEVGYRCIRWLSATHEYWNADDFLDAMDTYYPQVKTHEGRAFGAMIRHAVRDRLIEITDNYRASRRPERHKRPIPMYHSLVYMRKEPTTTF